MDRDEGGRQRVRIESALSRAPSEFTPMRTAKNLVRRAVCNRFVKKDLTFAGKKSKPLWDAQANMVKQKVAESQLMDY
ncbi:hypothetical protein Aduo_012441 [Ancylostoma duodenale]